MKVLVTDGHLKTSLAAVRALGRRGVDVHTTQYQRGVSLCGLSRFHARGHVLPPPAEAAAHETALLELAERERFDRLLVASEGALTRIASCRESLASFVRLDLPPPESIEISLHKERLLEFAERAGVPIPPTVFHQVGEPLDVLLGRLRFPLVGKTGERTTYERVRYLNDRADLEAQLGRYRPGETVIFQEFVEGDGYGLFAFCRDGEPVVVLMHRRILEYPRTGGPSVLAETVDEPELRELGLRLLRSLRWNGLAMVEFKRRKSDDRFVLMEINPRLWGSLDLGVAAGVDFPWVAVGGIPEPEARSLGPGKVRFLFIPDALIYAAAYPLDSLRVLSPFLSRRVRTNVHWDDPRPALRQVREAAYWVRTLALRGALRAPHGRPERRNRFEFDLHAHSSSSFDSASSPRSLLRAARRAGLSAFAVTDHGTVEGALRVRAANDDPDLAVIVGTEIRTEDAGDLVALFVTREIGSRRALEVVREVHEQGGLVMIPHPYSYGVTRYDEELLRRVDLVELRNGRTRNEPAAEILRLAERAGRPVAGNSDAHVARDLGCTRGSAWARPASEEELKALLRSGRFEIVGDKSPWRSVPASQAIKAWKARRPGRVAFHAWWWVKSTIRDVVVARLVEPRSVEPAPRSGGESRTTS